MSTTITPQIVGQGYHGIYRINERTGQQIGHTIRVWHASVDGRRIGTFRTRQEAREAVSDFRAWATDPHMAERRQAFRDQELRDDEGRAARPQFSRSTLEFD